MQMSRSQMLKGVLDVAVLALLQRSESYGYAIVARLVEAGMDDVGEASVYATLLRLEQVGLLASRKVRSPEGPPRKYYRLTASGETALKRGTEEWRVLVEQMKGVLDET
jgi:PadR family transcriptional regulator, regulatory protein PadR